MISSRVGSCEDDEFPRFVLVLLSKEASTEMVFVPELCGCVFASEV